MIYLDYAATTPFLPENIKLYSELTADYFYNHESLHAGGDEVKSLREAAEHYLDDMFTDNLTTIVTTSASEANRIAIELYLYGKHQPRVLVSPLEHPSIFSALEQHRAELILLPIEDGRVQLDAANELIAQVDLVIMQHTHSETGLLMPVEALSLLCREYNVPYHCDIVQAAGKLPVDTTGMTSYAFSAHKFYGPKGIGALRIKPDYIRSLNPHFHHEYGTKNGTLDIPAFAVMAHQLTAMQPYIQNHLTYTAALKRQLLAGLNDAYRTLDYEMSPYIIPLISRQYEGQYMMQRLSQEGILISTGTACGHGTIHSIGLTQLIDPINQYFRVSLSHLTTPGEVSQLAAALNRISEEFHDSRQTSANR